MHLILTGQGVDGDDETHYYVMMPYIAWHKQSVQRFARAQAVEHDGSSQRLVLDVHPQGTLYGEKKYLPCGNLTVADTAGSAPRY